jgi:photosystem II stability/assembly factor-like uncharacterized protein
MRTLAGVITIAAFALTACASPGSASPGSGFGAGIEGHVHNLAVDGERLLLGTHEGLWEQRPGQEPQQLSQDAFDVMGLTLGPDRWYASGHPGDGMDAPSDLGLLASDDAGRTWSEVSLGGEVDFHRLVASGDVVLGVNAHDGRLLRSEDDGLTWTDLGTPPLFDIAIDPADPAVVVATTENGLVRSTDGGRTFTPVATSSLLALLAWNGTSLVAGDTAGRVHASTDAGLTWSPLGTLEGQPAAIAAEGETVAVQVDNDVLVSEDGGRTFEPRITDLAGH